MLLGAVSYGYALDLSPENHCSHEIFPSFSNYRLVCLLNLGDSMSKLVKLQMSPPRVDTNFVEVKSKVNELLLLQITNSQCVNITLCFLSLLQNSGGLV